MLELVLRRLGHGVASCACLLSSACDGERNTPSPPAGAAGAAAQASTGAPAPPGEALDAQAIGERLGVAAVAGERGAVLATIPRAGLAVTVDGAPAPKALELGTSLEFRPSSSGATLTGHVALLEDEVGPATDTLLAHGITPIGLHNRFAFDEPRVLLMHFGGEGNPALLASGVQSLGAAIRDARLRSPQPLRGFAGDAPTAGKLDAEAIGGALGVVATQRDGEVVLSVPRPGDGAAAAGAEPLLRTVWLGSDLHAAVEGQFSLTPGELSPVLGALRRSNLHLTALHRSGSQGQELSLAYFRGKGSSVDLVRALRLALEARTAGKP